MKYPVTLIALFFFNVMYAGTCLPGGITFTTQPQIDNFQTDYFGCTEIEGDVIIEDDNDGIDNITNLNGLDILAAGATLNILAGTTLKILNAYTYGYGIENWGDFTCSGTLYIYDVNGSGIYNRSTVTNYGDITIDKVGRGIYNFWLASFINESGGTFTVQNSADEGIFSSHTSDVLNKGIIHVNNITSKGIDHLAGSFTNDTGAEIYIDNTGGPGIRNGGATFINRGKIDMSAGIGTSGIGNQNTGAVFTNESTGTIYIDNANQYGIGNSQTFNNYGIIEMSEIGNRGIDNTASFTNYAMASITIQNIGVDGVSYDYGINNQGAFINQGALSMTLNTNDDQDYGIYNFGSTNTFTNEIMATLSIANTGDDGIYNHGIFTNKSTLTLTSLGGFGIFNTNVFSNESGASIFISDTGDDGIQNNNVCSFTNGGDINMTTGISGNGIYNTSASGDAIFENAIDATLNILHAGENGIYCRQNAVFKNYGTATVSNTTELGMYNFGATVNNYLGGMITVNGDFLGASSSTTINDGILEVTGIFTVELTSTLSGDGEYTIGF